MRAIRKTLKVSMRPISPIIFTQEEDGNFLLRSLNNWPPSPSAGHQARYVLSPLTLSNCSMSLPGSKSHFYQLLIQH